MSGPLLTLRLPVASMLAAHVTVPSLLILGTDAVVAATPATPVQLVHACLAMGYQAVIPASWGDELIAGRVLDRLRETDAPVLQCSCPLVARRLAIHGASLAPSVVAVASPPVATARYLRALYAPTRPYITYVGACPSADHETIDVTLTPDALASALAERGISSLAQPTEFDEILPPDRRRFFSEPGGAPSRAALRDLGAAVALAEPATDDLAADVAQHLLSGTRVLIDVAPALGCACAGMREDTDATRARASVKAVEPPRALGPVVDHDLPLILEPVTPAPALRLPDVPAPVVLTDVAVTAPQLEQRISGAIAVAAEPMPAQVDTVGRQSSGSLRAVLGTMPQSRTDAGRQLPRAYIARRRTTPRGIRGPGVGARGSSGALNRPMTRWVAVTMLVVGAGLIAAWLFQLSR